MNNRSSMTVLLADEHDSYRRKLRRTLKSEDDIEVIGDTSNGQRLKEQVAHMRPRIVLMDYNILTQLDLGSIHEMRQSAREPAVIIHIMYDVRDVAEKAVKAGAYAYLLKDLGLRSLLNAIHGAAKRILP